MRAALVAAAVAWMGAASAGWAAEITVFTGGSMRAPLEAAAPAFEKASGHTVRFVSGTTADIMRRLDAGETPDVVVISDDAMAGLEKAGRVVAGARRDLARPVIGVAVRKGAAPPDVSNPAALKTTLLAAKSVAYPDPARGAVTGLFVTRLFEQLGVTAQMKAKTVVRPTGAAVAQATAAGEADLALTFVSELLPEKRLVVRRLPETLQSRTVYAAALWGRARASDAGRAFVAYAAGPAVRPVLAAAGVEPVGR